MKIHKLLYIIILLVFLNFNYKINQLYGNENIYTLERALKLPGNPPNPPPKSPSPPPKSPPLPPGTPPPPYSP